MVVYHRQTLADDMPPTPTPALPIEDLLVASNDLVNAVCEPVAALGLEAPACRILLALWESDGLTTEELAQLLGAERARTEGWLDALEGADLVRRTPQGASVRLTEQGRAIPVRLTDSCEDRFGTLHSDLVSFRDLLQRTLHHVECAATERRAA